MQFLNQSKYDMRKLKKYINPYKNTTKEIE